MTTSYDDHPWLYDAAFSWDVTDEVVWLRERFGPGARSVLEPACGSGRMLAGLARAGLDVAGFDRSASMLARARARFDEDGLPPPLLLDGELSACGGLEFGRAFDAAVIPLGTFGYLTEDAAAAAHLEGVARHLRSGSKYLIQYELNDLGTFTPREPGPTCQWEMPRPQGSVRCTVFGRDWDATTGVTTEIQRYEVLDGPDAGLVRESEHRLGVRGWEGWRALIDASPFTQTAAYDGNARDRAALPVGAALEDRLLVWQELTLA